MTYLNSDIFRFKGISLLERSPRSISFFEKDTKLGEIFNKMFKIEVIKFVAPTLILDYVNNWITQNNVSLNSIGQRSVIEAISGFYDYLFLQINGNRKNPSAIELRFEQFIAANDFMTEAMRVVNEFIIGNYYSARGKVLLLDENNYNDKLHLVMTVIFCFRYGASVYFNRNFKMLIPRKDLNASDKLYFNRLSTLKRAGVYKDLRDLNLDYESRSWPDYPLESLNFPLSQLTRNQNEMKKFMSIYNDQIAPYPKLVDDQRWQKLKTIYRNYYADGKINSKEDDERYTRAILNLLNSNEKFSDDQIISSSIFENDPQKALTDVPKDLLTHILFYADYRQTIKGEGIMELYSNVLRKLSLMDKRVYDESYRLHQNGAVEFEYHMEASIPILFNNMKSIGEGIQGSVELMEHVIDEDINTSQALFPVVRKRMRAKNEEVELEKEYIVGRVLSKYYEKVPTIMYTYAIGETWNSISTAVQHGSRVPNSEDIMIDLRIKSYLHDHMRFTDLTKQIPEFSDVNLESKRGIYLEHIDNSNVFFGMISFGDDASRIKVNEDIRKSYIVNGNKLRDHVDLTNYTILVLYNHLRYLKGKARFLHRDLHSNNVLIQNYPSKLVALPLYDAKGELSSYLETNVMPRIIDYGFAVVDVQEDIPNIGNFTTAAPLPVFGSEAAAMDFLALYSIPITSTMFNIIDLGPRNVSDKEIKSSVIYSYALAKLLCNDALKIPKIIYPEGDNEIDWTVLFNPRSQDVDSVMNMVPSDSPLRLLKFKTFQVLVLNMNNVKMASSIDDSIHDRRGIRHDIHFHKRFRYISNVFIDYDIDGSYDYVKYLLSREEETTRFMQIFDASFVPQEGTHLISGRDSDVVLRDNAPTIEQIVDKMYLQESLPMMMANVVLRGEKNLGFLQGLQELDNKMIETRIKDFISFEMNFIDEDGLYTLNEIKDIAYPNLTDNPEIIYDMAYAFTNMLNDPKEYLKKRGISLKDCQLIAENKLSPSLIYKANTTFMKNNWVIRNRIGSIVLAMRLMIVRSLKLVRILGILNYLRDFVFVQNEDIREFVQQKIRQIKKKMNDDRANIVNSFLQNVPSNEDPKVIGVRNEIIHKSSGRRIEIPDVAKVFWAYAEKFRKYCPVMYSKDLVKMGVIIETEPAKFYQ